MANYSLVINSKFRPFEFQELMQPAMLATQAHQTLEDAYSELGTKSSIWDNLTEGSVKAKRQYQKFANDLANEAELLAKQGLTSSSRQAVLNMRNRYSRDIVPIEQAYKKREAQIEEQRKAMLANPTLLLSRNAAETNLDSYLDNPDLGYNMTTGALLQQQVATQAAALAKAARDDPKAQTELRHLLGFQYETIRRKGFSPDEVLKAINNAEGANPQLVSIVDKVLESSGINKWNMSDADRKAIMKQARVYANEGLWSAVGETQYGTATDDRAKALFEHDLAEKRAINAANRARQQVIQDAMGQPVVPKFDRRNVMTSREIEKAAQNKEAWNKYKKYFYKTESGNWAINKEGRDLYMKGKGVEQNPAYGTWGERAMTNKKGIGWDLPSASFYNFVNSVGLSGAGEGRLGPNQTRTLSKFLTKNVKNQYDATQATEYYSPVDASNYDNVVGALSRASKNGEITTYERVKSDNSYKFVPKKEKINLQDLIKTGIGDASTVYGQHGNYLEVTLKDGTRFDLPYSYVNSQFNEMLTHNVEDALKLEAAMNQGKQYYINAAGQPEDILTGINRALNNAHNTSMSGLGTSTIKNQETERGLYQFYIPQ